MTTITIRENIEGLQKTNFKNVEELFIALKQVSPIKLYQVDADEFSPIIIERIENKTTFIVTEISDHQ